MMLNPFEDQMPNEEILQEDGQLASKIGLKDPSRLLKICLFASGFVGIVTEYVLSTLASYLLGNPIIHWPIIISLMLFTMGLGSRAS